MNAADDAMYWKREAMLYVDHKSAACDALSELRVAWCVNMCDAKSPDDEAGHLPECEAARKALLSVGYRP